MTFEEWFEKAYEPTYPIEGWEIEDLREAWEAGQKSVLDCAYEVSLAVPKGYVLVPVEPTEELCKVIARITSGYNIKGADYLYKAMIKAAQEEE